MESLTHAYLKTTHIVLQKEKKKKTFTKHENVVMPCLEAAADLIQRGEEAMKKVKQSPFIDIRKSRRCVMLANNQNEQLAQKFHLGISFGFQKDETTDIEEAQLIAYCRFPGLKKNTMSEHYLSCLQLGVERAAHIFQKRYFIVEEGIDWSKCKSVTIDDEKAMVGAIWDVKKSKQSHQIV